VFNPHDTYPSINKKLQHVRTVNNSGGCPLFDLLSQKSPRFAEIFVLDTKYTYASRSSTFFFLKHFYSGKYLANDSRSACWKPRTKSLCKFSVTLSHFNKKWTVDRSTNSGKKPFPTSTCIKICNIKFHKHEFLQHFILTPQNRACGYTRHQTS